MSSPAEESSHSPTPSTPLPAEAVAARTRLLHAALRLFAEHGFAKTSIRQVAQAACVNPASISYYFGDKSGLYRAAFTEPMGGPVSLDAWPKGARPPTVREAITLLIGSFMQPLHEGELVELCMRLHFREMLDPTGLWQQELECDIKPDHAALVGLLCEEFGLNTADDDVHRLAMAITALALQYYVGRDVVQAVRPGLTASPRALAATTSRLVDFACFMVDGERERRLAARSARGIADPLTAPGPTPPSKSGARPARKPRT
jgi:AcrR family transcriptional regulator